MKQIKCGKGVFRFSVGPWNMHPGADPFGPPVRTELGFLEKIRLFKKLGFGAIQFHDDDVCPAGLSPAATRKATREMKKLLRDHGLEPEFVAPVLGIAGVLLSLLLAGVAFSSLLSMVAALLALAMMLTRFYGVSLELGASVG